MTVLVDVGLMQHAIKLHVS